MYTRSILRFFSPILLCSLLIACAEGPNKSLTVAQQGLLSGAINADKELSIIGSIHHGGSLWDTKKQERLYSWNHKSEGFSSFRQVALSKDGKVAVTTEEKAIGVWDATNGKSLNFWEAKDRILAIDLSEKGDKALIGMRDGTVDYFDLKTGQVIHRFLHQAEVRSVALAENAQIGISGSDDFSAITWDLKAGKQQGKLELSNQIKTVAISETGKTTFVSAQREGAYLMDNKLDKKKAQLPGHYVNYTSVEFAKKDAQLLVGTSAGMIELWSIKGVNKLKEWQSKPKKAFGRASSKAILGVGIKGKSVKALTSDGTVQTFGM